MPLARNPSVSRQSWWPGQVWLNSLHSPFGWHCLSRCRVTSISKRSRPLPPRAERLPQHTSWHQRLAGRHRQTAGKKGCEDDRGRAGRRTHQPSTRPEHDQASIPTDPSRESETGAKGRRGPRHSGGLVLAVPTIAISAAHRLLPAQSRMAPYRLPYHAFLKADRPVQALAGIGPCFLKPLSWPQRASSLVGALERHAGRRPLASRFRAPVS